MLAPLPALVPASWCAQRQNFKRIAAADQAARKDIRAQPAASDQLGGDTRPGEFFKMTAGLAQPLAPQPRAADAKLPSDQGIEIDPADEQVASRLGRT
jgi:hypothetical protein